MSKPGLFCAFKNTRYTLSRQLMRNVAFQISNVQSTGCWQTYVSLGDCTMNLRVPCVTITAH